MLLPRVTGTYFNRKKVLRLLKKFNITSDMRVKRRKETLNNLPAVKYKKPNILKRKFKLGKSHEIYLTDVTYLKYKNNKTAYLSVIKDSVTTRVVAYYISENNDSTLISNTIKQVDVSVLKPNAILHSDQGVLYLSPTYQDELVKLNFSQSMSKRGNCQDNAPIESFFSIFKQECSVKDCLNIDDIRIVLQEYIKYFNNVRPQENLNKMTPMEYENWLNELSDEEYFVYYNNQLDKYNIMLEKSKLKAINRNKQIGV